MASFRIIDSCPINPTLAPYVYVVLKRAKQQANSIYRGEDAKAILHAHGKQTQAEIYASYPPGVADRPGTSTHELRSDGVAYTGPVGRKLEYWQQGVDSGTNSHEDKVAIDKAAAFYGWTVFHPYKAGVEGHHFSFKYKPKAKTLRMRLELIAIRARLPRH